MEVEVVQVKPKAVKLEWVPSAAAHPRLILASPIVGDIAALLTL